MPGVIDPHNPRACPADACLDLDHDVSDLLSHTFGRGSEAHSWRES